MYAVLLTLQITSTIILAAMAMKLLLSNKISSSKYLIITSLLVVFYSVGYLSEMFATTRMEAIICLRFEYLGISFMALAFYKFVTDYCRCKGLPTIVRKILFAFDVVCMFSVFLCENTSIYYKRLSFISSGIFPHVETEKGIFYWIFAIQQAVLLVLCSITFRQDRRARKGSPDRKYFLLLFYESLLPIAGIIVNMTSILPEYDFGSLMTGLMLAGFILTLSNDRLYDIKEIALGNIYHNIENGIIIADEEMKYVDSNIPAVDIFEPLQTFTQGTPIQNLEKDICIPGPDKYFEINGKFYKSHCTRLFEKRRHIGYIIEVSDITDMHTRLDEMASLKEDAEAANKAKSVFLANMSHEIRTPLNAIIGMAALSQRENSEEVVKDYVSQIESAGNMLLGIVSDVLDFSKAESGKLEIVPVEYNFLELLNSVINVINMRIGDKPIDFLVDIDPTIPSILYGDDIRIKQILMNFLSNADKYTDSGHIKLTVDHVHKGSEFFLKFSVEDTGRGIADKDKEKLFNPFTQVDLEKNRKITGTGLGLSIAGRLIILMGGNYSVDSEYGKGSTFSFSIKQEIVRLEAISTEARELLTVPKASTFKLYNNSANNSNEDTGTEEFPKFPGARVLVVDDNKVNVKVICAFLKHFGIVADYCYSGSESLEMTRKNEYDIIFMDHMMPDMDGIETTEKLRVDPDNLCRDSVIIACTANVVKGVQELFKDAGLNDFVPKPLQIGVLKEKLVKYLR